MTLSLDWQEMGIRLLCTLAACGIIGFERGEAERAAGMRTTMLVGLAACLSMVLANWLLITTGKTPESFSVIDTLRLPLGTLSGVGFIGAGAILRRDNLVIGLTTAATLWYITAVGLCFGGGEYVLGWGATALGLLILSGLKPLERHLRRDRNVTLRLRWRIEHLSEGAVRKALSDAGLHISRVTTIYDSIDQIGELDCRLNWRTLPGNHDMPPAIRALADMPGMLRLEWTT